MASTKGKKVVDISELLGVFEAQEGEVQQIIGKTGNGKTYEGTRRALEYLQRGFVVYTTWHLILPEVYDQREDKEHVFFNTLAMRKRFYSFPLKENWHYLDIDRPDLIEFVASLTDCIVFMDEGQDVFDARGGMDRPARKAITRTRHMRKTLIIISQRAQAVDVTARANVTYFYKCVKTFAWFWPFATYFKVYRTEEMDDQNYPVWEERLPNGEMWNAPVWQSHFASQKVYDAYNSWYLRDGIAKSQEVYFEAYDLTLGEKLSILFAKKQKKPIDTPYKDISPHLKELSTAIKNTRKTNEKVVELTHVQEPTARRESQERRKRSSKNRKAVGYSSQEGKAKEEIAYVSRTENERAGAERLQPQAKEARPEAPYKTIRVKEESAGRITAKSRILTGPRV